jgi:8-oxo-dGTP diphosphatase
MLDFSTTLMHYCVGVGDTVEGIRVRAAGLGIVGSAVLLAEHSKNGKSYWLLPGGGVRVGESAKTALKRELKEELNIEVAVRDLLFVVETWSQDGIHIIQPTFLLDIVETDGIAVGRDSRVVGFELFGVSDLEGRTIYPDIREEILEYLKYRKVKSKYIYKPWVE